MPHIRSNQTSTHTLHRGTLCAYEAYNGSVTMCGRVRRFDRVSETRTERGLQLRARLLLEIEDAMDASRKEDESAFPR
eukprot:1885900-Prymnesium_polylepis.1